MLFRSPPTTAKPPPGGGGGRLAWPVNGVVTSGFGMRFHPILGYTRFHRGVDYGAAYGSPIYAASDGLVSFAGRHAGNGNYVLLTHSAVLGTSYGLLTTWMPAKEPEGSPTT